VKIIIFKEKHANRYVSLEHGREAAARMIAKERLENEWYVPEDEAKLRSLLVTPAKDAKVFNWMSARIRNEYEGFEFEDIEVPEKLAE
jgi:hypothetical protein